MLITANGARDREYDSRTGPPRTSTVPTRHPDETLEEHTLRIAFAKGPVGLPKIAVSPARVASQHRRITRFE